jgi:hypothetical protein
MNWIDFSIKLNANSCNSCTISCHLGVIDVLTECLQAISLSCNKNSVAIGTIWYQSRNWLQFWSLKFCSQPLCILFFEVQPYLACFMILTWIQSQFHVTAPKGRGDECTTRLIHQFHYESQLIIVNLNVQTCNQIRRVTQTLQLITITNIIELFLWTVLGRVIKTLQPSSISSHTPSHHDWHQKITKKS